MKAKKSEIKIGVVLSYVQIFIHLATSLIYVPIMIRLLGQSEYGLYNLVSSVIGYLSLFNLGFTGSYLRFNSKYVSNKDKNGEAKLNGLFMLLFLFLGFIVLITGMILSQYTTQIFGNKLTIVELNKSKILMQILVVNMALTFPSAIFDAIINSKEKFIFQKLVNIVGEIFNPIVNLPLLLLGYGSVTLALTTTFITITKLIVNMYYCMKKIKSKFIFKNLELNLLKEMFIFSLFIFINMIIDQVNWSVDKLILGRIIGTASVGIYGIGATFSTIMMQLAGAISSVFCPRVNMIEARNEKDKDNQHSDLLIRVGRFQYMLILFITIGFAFAGKAFINIWAGKEYTLAYYVALFLMMSLVLILPHNLSNEIRKAKNKHKVPTIVQLVIVIFNLVISIPLAKRFGAPGSALGTFIGNMIYLFFIDYYYIKVLKLDIKRFYKNIINITISVLPAVIFGLIGCIKSNLFFNFIWAIIYTIMYIILLYKKGMDEYEKENINKILNKLKLFKKNF